MATCNQQRVDDKNGRYVRSAQGNHVELADQCRQGKGQKEHHGGKRHTRRRFSPIISLCFPDADTAAHVSSCISMRC